MNNTAQPPDQAVRDQALDPAGSFIVQAPAGSGKTDLLIKRYLRLLASVERPEAILAITFTRKAAAEMRQRVLDALRQADEPADSDNEKHLRELARAARERDRAQNWQLADNPARLRIQTIDAFNAELTRQLPLLAGFGAQPQITETPAELYEEAVRQTLEELESGRRWSASIAALLNHLDNDWHKAHALLTAMLPKREQWLAQIRASTDRAYAEQALANEVVHQLEQLRLCVPDTSADDIVALAGFAAGNLEPDASAIAGCRELAALPAATVEALPQWRGLAELLLTRDGGWRKKLNKNQGLPPEAKEQKARIEQLLQELADAEDLRRRLHAVRELPEPRFEDRQWQLLEALTKLLPLAVAQLRVVFAADGRVDFPEMAARALQALGDADNPTDLGLRLDYRISHILVDEFQDTSVIQNELLKLLTAGWQRGDGRTLFLVGDPMQSIYRFRAADVGLFLETAQNGLGDIALTPLQLGTNFRSAGAIVDWVNQCFRQVLPQHADIASGAVPYAPSAAWHGSSGPAVSVYPQFSNDTAAEARQVLNIINQESGAGTSIAVLVQTRNHLAGLVPLLRQQGIRYRAMEIERLGHQPVVLDLLALTQALVHPADRISWLSLLRAPWCGLTRQDLHALAAWQPEATGPELVNADDTLLTHDGRQRLQRVREVLNTAIAERRRQTLLNTVESAWYALGGPASVQAAAALDDAAAFFRLLESMEDGGDLLNGAALIRELERLFAPPDPEAGEDALQIMTVHKAKGLEFDRVIIPGLGRRPRHDDPQLLLWQIRQRAARANLLIAPLTAAGAERDPVYRFIQTLERERGEYERGRLLYVACTRARRKLHLLGHTTVKEKDDGSYELKAPQSGSNLSLLWPQLAASYKNALADYHGEDDANQADGQASVYVPRRLRADWSVPPLAGPVVLPAPPAETAESAMPIEFSWAGETARVIGIVVHRLLQRIARDGADAWPQSRIEQLNTAIRALLIQQGLPDERRPAAIEQVRQALQNTLNDARGRWILDSSHEQADSELALTRLDHGRLESVVIDRTFVDKDGSRWIIDYKTGSHGGGDAEAFLDRERERYQPQLERYAEFMHSLEQRPVRLGLYFPLMAGWREW